MEGTSIKELALLSDWYRVVEIGTYSRTDGSHRVWVCRRSSQGLVREVVEERNWSDLVGSNLQCVYFQARRI